MTAIELAQVGLVEEMTKLTAAISAASIEDAKEAHDRLGVAREWARLQEDAAALAERLVWVEAVILRRIGQLDPKVLPPARRSSARHFAELDDAGLSSLLEAFPARSAVASYNLWARAEGIRKARDRGRSFIRYRDESADHDDVLPSTLSFAISERVLSVRQAAAVIVEEYATLPKTVSSVVDDFIDDWAPIHDGSSPLEVTAFRKGLTAAVREAFVAAPVETTERSYEIPAYITTFNAETQEWLRVPSEFATVAQARQMLALRQGQVESAQRSLAALKEVFEYRFAISTADPDDYLRGDATAVNRRLALRGVSA